MQYKYFTFLQTRFRMKAFEKDAFIFVLDVMQ